ncbi:response regulator transcription factor [Endothiovibrio diazotrophicus]
MTDGVGESPSLTARETECVRLIAGGASSSDIARRLHISLDTVNTHIFNAKRKMNVSRRGELVAKAVMLGFIDLR